MTNVTAEGMPAMEAVLTVPASRSAQHSCWHAAAMIPHRASTATACHMARHLLTCQASVEAIIGVTVSPAQSEHSTVAACAASLVTLVTARIFASTALVSSVVQPGTMSDKSVIIL